MYDRVFIYNTDGGLLKADITAQAAQGLIIRLAKGKMSAICSYVTYEQSF